MQGAVVADLQVLSCLLRMIPPPVGGLYTLLFSNYAGRL